MDLWIPITLAAAFCQNLRSALQKQLKGQLSTWGATASRFVFAAPLAVLFTYGLMLAQGDALPGIPGLFYLYGALGGLCQIVATGLLIYLFSRANFSAATAFTKTEPVQTALFGIILLGDHPSVLMTLAIMISLAGVMMISIPKAAASKWKPDRALWIGILSGGLFGLSAVAFRGASLSLSDGDALLRAAITVSYVTFFQAVTILLWMWLREPGQITKLFKAWRMAGLVGLVGLLGSLGWVTAFTLQNAAYVRALGQIDIVFTLCASLLVFKETLTAREITGVLLVTLGVVVLVLAAG
ncbi:MAG: DMT family transporter [Alphaproteobacteria bacterium]|nr:hypothetical protein [Hyphomonas sp.]MBR9806275.1 DMT family transporter [Alphaproteobacteria bacterium]|tara:strand:- start:1209 stop:2102 length:894 start_codon:yes stop_codon:yes gene_type:complete